MIGNWLSWVNEVDPSIIVGHNLFGYDLPFLQQVFKNNNLPFVMGRNDSTVRFNHKPSQFRKDGSQSYDYVNAHIYGREIVDTMFLAMKYDIARNYESYGLKQIIKQEGLEKAGRTFYDASQIATDWQDPVKREEIKKYALDDSDDALKLFDLMIPSLFYHTQSTPRSLQQNVNSASGSQVNSIMVRGYLQQGHSIALGSEAAEYEGAIAFSNPGIHKNVLRFDVASLYPSVIRQYKICNREKDPQELFLTMIDFFTEERLKNKKLAKETGERYYKDLEQSQKTNVINSAYGFLGAPKLNYNYPAGAAEVTKHGRRILTEAMEHLTSNRGVELVAGDTDGLAFKKADEKPWSTDERKLILDDLNSLMDGLIHWEDDGVLKRQIVVRTKNYVMQDESGKVTVKGSGLKATTKEKALKRFINEMIDLFLTDKKDQVLFLYLKYAREILDIKDITDWCSKKTVTKAVLEGERTNETRVMDALRGSNYREGDKVYMFFKTDTELCLRENFDGTYDKDILLGKLHDTLEIFDTLIDTSVFPDFSLKRNKPLLESLGVVNLEVKNKSKVVIRRPKITPELIHAITDISFLQTRKI